MARPSSPQAPTLDEMTLDELRPVLVGAALPHVPFDGWSAQALERAAADLGVPADRARLAFGSAATRSARALAGALVQAYIARADAEMVRALDGLDLGQRKVRDRITLAVRTRLEQAAADKEAVRRAAHVLGLPGNARLSARSLWRTADAMWRAAGDTATDYNHYTKRAILSAVYGSVLLVWLNDQSEDHAETWAFLDRRIAGVMQFEKTKAKLTGWAERLPDVAGRLGQLRHR